MKMSRTGKRIRCFFVFVTFLMILRTGQTADASGAEMSKTEYPGQYEEENREKDYVNKKTDYRAVFEDDASLIEEEKQDDLLEKMKDITRFGNVAFKSILENSSSTRYFAEEYYYELFGTDSGLLFVVDMDERCIWIYCDGKIYRTIDEDYANTITDNVYRYASKGDYYNCAWNVYDQAFKVLNGRRIAMPMKYICNILLAVSLGLLINFFLVKFCSRKNTASIEEVMRGEQHELCISDVTAKLVGTTKTYSPRSSGSSGSSGSGSSHSSRSYSSSHSSSHSSGGGSSSHSSGHSHSGGGGGHRF